GIAASRLSREYNRPVLLFALEGERASGSGRSIPGLSLHATLKEMGSRFFEFGGHDQAVGGSVSASEFGLFRREVRAFFAERVPRERFVRREVAEAELPLEEISDELLRHLERFEPHGAGNPRPVFSCGAARAETPFRAIGESGWKGRLAHASGSIDAVAWREAASAGERSASGDFAIDYRVSRSRWSGRPEVEIVSARDRTPSPLWGEGRGERSTPLATTT
ncbi:MAG TPA: DHHA1 domain-containing protein, partial [Thermoanaerobaculia bacterium]|nr:DHHA1 domain-containing protein [Thermoanaerobaculia bacterium]